MLSVCACGHVCEGTQGGCTLGMCAEGGDMGTRVWCVCAHFGGSVNSPPLVKGCVLPCLCGNFIHKRCPTRRAWSKQSFGK